MKRSLRISLFLVLIISVLSCNNKTKTSEASTDKRQTVEMITDRGTMIIELYNETPLHRDNFIKLAKESAFDSLLFHRVIETFMIQGGDPDSKYALPGDMLGEGDLNYQIDAEFHPDLFHKKGALAAARDDIYPNKVSSSMQFYIVQGEVYQDSILDKEEAYLNRRMAKEFYQNDPDKKQLLDSSQKAKDEENWELAGLYLDTILNSAKNDENFKMYTIPEIQREIYRTVGGVPFLDQNYTVFGEVIQGIDVIDSIAAVRTDSLDRPITDIRIRTIKVLE